jgi:hypothetical protein
MPNFSKKKQKTSIEETHYTRMTPIDDELSPGSQFNPVEPRTRILELEMALKVISIWAKCDHLSGETRKKAMGDIRSKADAALGWGSIPVN